MEVNKMMQEMTIVKELQQEQQQILGSLEEGIVLIK
jgi:hypothetical protein